LGLARGRVKLVLQPDDQLVKIKTVIGIDDHSDGEHARVRQNLKADRRIPHSSIATECL
jgi:hypothetical protein